MSIVEKAFLGSLLKADYLLRDTIIIPEQLASERHTIIMRNMLQLSLSGMNVDLISLTTMPNLEAVGGMSYLSELLTYADVEKFDGIETLILDEWKEREKKTILNLAMMNNWEITKVISELDKINQLKMGDHISITQALANIFEDPWEEKNIVKTPKTGITHLDVMTGGFQNGEVTILAGRPSMGKTDMMLHFAKMVGWAGFMPLIFSLEMSKELLIHRLVASTGSFNRARMRDTYRLLSEKQKDAWPAVLGHLNETHIEIFDGAGQTISEIRAKTRRMMHEIPDKKPILFIDYLSIIQPSHLYGGNAHLQVTEISKALKTMAKDFDCPVVCLAQLNRSVESRANKRPLMSDIRESGSVEQDADVILFLYRDLYYNENSDNHSLEIIVSKNRNGPVGTVAVDYNKHTGKIEEIKKQ